MALRPYQISIADILLTTTFVAALVAGITFHKIEIIFLTTTLLFVFIRHRPVLVRCWLIAMIGGGSGFLAAMIHLGMFHGPYHEEFGATSELIAGWGTGLAVGGLVAWRAFDLPPLKPPEEEKPL